MNRPDCDIVIVATTPEAMVEVCGVSLLERLLRVLQRLGVRQANVHSNSPDEFQTVLAKPSWARAEIEVKLHRTLEELRQALRRESALVVAAGNYVDPRLLAALFAAPAPAVLVRDRQALDAGVVPRSWLSDTNSPTEIFLRLHREAASGTAHAINSDTLETYMVDLRRDVPLLWFPAPRPEQQRAAEALVLDAAQNGTLDLPAKLHGPLETWIIARLCRTAITPMQITLFTAAVSAAVTVLFASGQLIAGTILALVVGVLDGLDGKQARVKVETTALGKREHVLDYVLELSWWTALAFHFSAAAQLTNAYAFLVLLVGSDIVDRFAKKRAKELTGRNLDDVAPIDRFVRLIGGRRNIYIWMLAAGLTLGIADKAFVALCCWGALTAAVHGLRAWWLAQPDRRRA